MTLRTPRFLLLLFLLPMLPLGRAQASPASGMPAWQDEDEGLEDQRADIKEQLAEFDALIKKLSKTRKPDPKPAIAAIDGFLGIFEDLGPLDRASMVDSLAAVLNIKRIRNNEEGEPQIQLYFAAAVALGEMGPLALKPLGSALGKKPFQKNADMLVGLAESLGQIGHVSSLKALSKLLSHDELRVVAAGARALGQLAELDEKTKKKLFEDLLKRLRAYRGLVDADPDDVDAYQDWGIVSGSIFNTLESLANHDEDSVPAWDAWWKANRKKKWS